MSEKMFAEIGAATGSVYRYFSPGDFIVELGEITMPDTDDGTKFIVETKIVESSRDDYKKGETVSYVVKLFGKTKESAKAEVKAFVCRIGEMDENETPGAKIAAAIGLVTGEKRVFKGKNVRLHVDEPKPGKKFTKHHWSSISGE